MELVALQGGFIRPAIGCSTESVHFGVVLPVHDEEELALRRWIRSIEPSLVYRITSSRPASPLCSMPAAIEAVSWLRSGGIALSTAMPTALLKS